MSLGLSIGAIVWGGSLIACVWFALEVLRSSRPEQSIAAWILLFLLIPPLGVALYLVLGRRKLRKRAGRSRLPLGGKPADGPPINLFDAIVRSHGLPPPYAGNEVTFCGTGPAACTSLHDLIDNARESLWVSVYILGNDRIGSDIVRRLAARAADGVQVRLLVDDLGSPDVRDEAFCAPLTAAGGQVARFMKMSVVPKSRHFSNLRNHRKIVIADQMRAWSGGMNLSEQYLGEASVPGFFHDLSFAIDGSAAQVYARIFAIDWEFSTGEKLAITGDLACEVATKPGAGVVQVIPAGPEIDGDSIYDIILTMVNQAQRRLWVVSPYFIPDVGLLRAFRLAARRGVDVRFLTDYASDLALIDFASIPYLRALANAGGKILRYRGGMIHAKALVMDDRLALAGTTNLDQRSLFLNFEVMALFYDPKDAGTIARWIEGFFDRCTNELPQATPARQVAEGVVRLFAPVL